MKPQMEQDISRVLTHKIEKELTEKEQKDLKAKEAQLKKDADDQLNVKQSLLENQNKHHLKHLE